MSGKENTMSIQAVILAAGRGERLRPLTDTVPKPMVLLQGKPILEHILETLPREVSGIVLVVGYLGEKIQEYFKEDWKGIPITYVLQKEQKGTFSALETAKLHLNGPFLVLMGDVLNTKGDMLRLVNSEFSVLVRKEKLPSEKVGVCIERQGMILGNILEKEKGLVYTYANCGAYKLSPLIFEEPVIYGPTGEEWLSSMVGAFAKKYEVRMIESIYHYTVTSKEDLLKFVPFK